MHLVQVYGKYTAEVCKAEQLQLLYKQTLIITMISNSVINPLIMGLTIPLSSPSYGGYRKKIYIQ